MAEKYFFLSYPELSDSTSFVHEFNLVPEILISEQKRRLKFCLKPDPDWTPKMQKYSRGYFLTWQQLCIHDQPTKHERDSC